MSNTLRRKNSYDKHRYVNGWIDDPEWLLFLQGKGNIFGPGRGKYFGLTRKQIYDKLNAKYHGDRNLGYSRRSYVKNKVRPLIRAKHKMELIEAIQNGIEDEVLFSEKKAVYCLIANVI